MKSMLIPGLDNAQKPLPFELQPIIDAGFSVFGYELLYRGPHPSDWGYIDLALLSHLAELANAIPRLFINLANQTILDHSLLDFVPERLRSKIIFELSEAHITNDKMLQLADRINTLAAQGLSFALDDFGSGLDGMLRLSVLEHVSVIKLDRLYLKCASVNRHSANSLALLVKTWRLRGIKVVAEGIETAEELAFAHRVGANFFQGYLIDARVSDTLSFTRIFPPSAPHSSYIAF